MRDRLSRLLEVSEDRVTMYQKAVDEASTVEDQGPAILKAVYGMGARDGLRAALMVVDGMEPWEAAEMLQKEHGLKQSE